VVVWMEGRGGAGTRMKLGSEFQWRGQDSRAALDRTAGGGCPHICLQAVP